MFMLEPTNKRYHYVIKRCNLITWIYAYQ